MTRKKKMLLNSSSSVIYQIIALICGFIVPRLILMKFGSSVNGLVSSITQFLGIITLCEMGVGSVVQSTLYKPLAENDIDQISKITISAEKFFRKIAFILVVYTIVLMGGYPFVTIGEFDYFFTFWLILVISISSFSQYYFGITYRLVLSADQLGFINFSIKSLTLILNTVMCVVLINLNASIHVVKLATSTLFLLQPIVISFIAKKRYKINRKVVITEEPIKQKWNGLAQHLASVVHGNTPTIALTLFSTLENVSVYAVYHLVVNGIKTFMVSLTDGMHSMIGNMLAKDETKTLNSTFDTFEWFMHAVVTVVFSITGALILPFVTVYTNGLTDANYIVPTFAILLVASEAIYCIRLPYNILILSAGHYKQTQTSAIVEAIISVAVSVVLLFVIGIEGVALGALCAMLYRTIYFVCYLSKRIVHRKISIFIKHMIVDMLCVTAFAGALFVFSDFFQLQAATYFDWFVLAIKVGTVCVLENLIINFIVYPSIVKKFINQIVKRKNKKNVIAKSNNASE